MLQINIQADHCRRYCCWWGCPGTGPACCPPAALCRPCRCVLSTVSTAVYNQQLSRRWLLGLIAKCVDSHSRVGTRDGIRSWRSTHPHNNQIEHLKSIVLFYMLVSRGVMCLWWAGLCSVYTTLGLKIKWFMILLFWSSLLTLCRWL